MAENVNKEYLFIGGCADGKKLSIVPSQTTVFFRPDHFSKPSFKDAYGPSPKSFPEFELIVYEKQTLQLNPRTKLHFFLLKEIPLEAALERLFEIYHLAITASSQPSVIP